MYTYKLTIAYDGRHYCGWQIQKNAQSIHQTMMEAGKKFIHHEFTITGGSRTDSGVHALGYVASLRTTYDIEPRRVQGAFNAHLPKDIVVLDVAYVAEEFHPRYHALGKHYRYTIFNHALPIPQYLHYAYHYRHPLDVSLMKKGASYLKGQHDFVAFSSIKTSVEDTVRTITHIDVTKEGHLIHIDVAGDGFLYNMVRMIAGMLIEVGRGQISPERIEEILMNKDREPVNKTAPANGLTLMTMYYDKKGEDL